MLYQEKALTVIIEPNLHASLRTSTSYTSWTHDNLFDLLVLPNSTLEAVVVASAEMNDVAYD